MKINAIFEGKSEPDAQNDVPFGVFTIKIQALDENDIPMNGVDLDITVEGVAAHKKIDTVTELHGTDYYTRFSFAPKKDGPVPLTIRTSENSLDIEV